jgi:predicted Zn-dependent protease with MMP-like domain
MSPRTGPDAPSARRRHRGRGGKQAPVHCLDHEVDLAAVQRFVWDGKPTGNDVTVAAVAAGECPACRPRYVAASGNGADARNFDPPGVRAVGGRYVACGCCRTAWEVEGDSWAATVQGGLQVNGRTRAIKAGKAIDASRFVVEPVNPVEGAEQALRAGFLAFDASTGRPAADDLVADVTEAMLASYRGEADERAELARITAEHHLDETTADSWHFVALAALGVIRGLQRNPRGAPPSAGQGPGTAASRGRFEQLVAAALDSIPPELGSLIENVAVVVEGEAENRDLFGLYQGVPLTARGRYAGATPDRITIYQDTISKYCHSEEQIVAQVRRTVIHEVAHHFGIDDPRLHELGW